MRIKAIAPTGQDKVTATNTAETTKGGTKTLTVGKLPTKGKYKASKGRHTQAPGSRSAAFMGKPIKGARSSAQAQAPDISSPTAPLSPQTSPSPDYSPDVVSTQQSQDFTGGSDGTDWQDGSGDGANYAKGGQVKRRGWGRARGG